MATHTPNLVICTLRKPWSCEPPPVINTPLQRGGTACRKGVNRFSGSCTVPQTAEAVQDPSCQAHTPLKRGVNESGSCCSTDSCVTFGLRLFRSLALAALTCTAAETKTLWQIGTKD